VVMLLNILGCCVVFFCGLKDAFGLVEDWIDCLVVLI
jgi:hypothetical protein